MILGNVNQLRLYWSVQGPRGALSKHVQGEHAAVTALLIGNKIHYFTSPSGTCGFIRTPHRGSGVERSASLTGSQHSLAFIELWAIECVPAPRAARVGSSKRIVGVTLMDVG